MKPTKIGRTTGLIIVVALAAIFVVQNQATNQHIAAESLDFATTMFSQDEWLRIGRERVYHSGLVGEPKYEETALMTFGSFLTLKNENRNDNRILRENPVFVYQVLGDVPVLKGFGMGSGQRDDIAGFYFVFDALTGMNLNAAALLKEKPGSLDLSFIPADIGPDLSRQNEVPPTLIPASDTADNPELVPVPAN